MRKIKVLYLYPDMLNLYGDRGNIQALQYRAEKREIKVNIDYHYLGGEAPDFSQYDIVFSGGGADKEQALVAKDMMQYKEEIRKAVQEGVFFLLVCGSYQLFGKYYKGVEGDIIPGLEIFDYYTEAIPDRSKRCIGDIIIEAQLGGKLTKVIGYENHAGQTKDVASAFGKVLHGQGNTFSATEEGFMLKNIIATYIHGTLLSKNPDITDYIIQYALERKLGEKIELEPLDDTFEKKAREQLINKLLTTSEKFTKYKGK